MSIVDKVATHLKDAKISHSASGHKTYERQIVMCGKTGDKKLLLQSYWNLAMYWEHVEEGTKAIENMTKAFELVVENRGGKEFLSHEDCSPIIRCWELTGKVTSVRELYAEVAKAKAGLYSDKDLRLLPFAWGQLDASLRLGNAGAAMVEQQAVQRIRESHMPETMQWYHPPQGERRTVTNIEFVASWVDIGRLHLLKKEFDKARDALSQVAEWREGIRKVGKDWRRKDASVQQQTRSFEVVADGMFRLGEAFVGLERFQTGENRMREGIGHWEELVELEEAQGRRNTCTHPHIEGLHRGNLVASYVSLIAFLIDRGRFTDAVPVVNSAIDQMDKAPMRAYSPLYLRTLLRRAKLQLDCHHIDLAIKDFDLSIELNTKLYGAESSQVGLTYSDKATFVQYLTDPTKQQMSLAISLATKGLSLLEATFDSKSTRLVPALRVLGCVLVRFGRLEEGIPILERYDAITKASPYSEKLPTDRIFALESLAEAYTNLPAAKASMCRSKAKACLRECMVIVIENEMQGRKDEVAVARINLKFEKLEHGVAMPLLERYVHPYLRSCSMCKKYEHRPDQFHIWMSQGAIRLCSRECHDKFIQYQNSNPWLNEDSEAAAGPLNDQLLLRILLGLPERPHWFRLAQTCNRLWLLVSQYRTSVRMPGMQKMRGADGEHKRSVGHRLYETVAPKVVDRLISRSPRLLHLDFSDATNIDDSICLAIGRHLRSLKTLSLRGCPHVTDIGLEEISECDMMERLDITHCTHVTDEGVCTLAKALPRLQYLSVSGCREVTEVSIEALAQGCPYLIYLDISYCSRITDRGLKALMKNCPHLQYVNLRGVNNISSAALHRAVKQIPQIDGVPWKEVVAADIVSTVDHIFDD